MTWTSPKTTELGRGCAAERRLCGTISTSESSLVAAEAVNLGRGGGYHPTAKKRRQEKKKKKKQSEKKRRMAQWSWL